MREQSVSEQQVVEQDEQQMVTMSDLMVGSFTQQIADAAMAHAQAIARERMTRLEAEQRAARAEQQVAELREMLRSAGAAQRARDEERDAAQGESGATDDDNTSAKPTPPTPPRTGGRKVAKKAAATPE